MQPIRERKLHDLRLRGPAYVEYVGCPAGIELGLGARHIESLEWLFLGHHILLVVVGRDPAELLVVDQLGDGLEVGILTQLQLAEVHAEGIVEEEPAREGVALPQ